MNGSRYAKKHDVILFQKQPEPEAFHFQRHQSGLNYFMKDDFYLFSNNIEAMLIIRNT